jgi:hypothetical protein
VIRRRDNGAGQLPGGVLERDETGLETEPERLTGVYQHLALGVVALVFRARLTGGAATPTEEASAVEWWPADTVAERMQETFAARILDALDDCDAPVVRSHDGVRFL